jgi:hypothetical protein
VKLKTILTTTFLLCIGINNHCFSDEIKPITCDYQNTKGEELVFAKKMQEEVSFYGWSTSPTDTSDNLLNTQNFADKKVKILKDEPLIADNTASSNHFYRKAIVDNCQIVYARFYNDDTLNYSGVISVDDLKKAKTYIGKTIWVNLLSYQNGVAYSKSTGQEKHLKNIQKMAVKDIFIGGINGKISTSGMFFDVTLEDKSSWLFPLDDSYFFGKYPLSKNRPKAIISAIQEMSIVIGMTKAEAKLSWGEPDDINRTVGAWGVNEQWIYNHTYLYFQNDKLTSFQD